MKGYLINASHSQLYKPSNYTILITKVKYHKLQEFLSEELNKLSFFIGQKIIFFSKMYGLVFETTKAHFEA